MTDVETDLPTQAPAEGSPDIPPPDAGSVADVPDAARPGADAGPSSAGTADAPTAATGSSRVRSLQIGLGVVRLGVGAALMAAPGWAGRVWVGPGADGPGSKVFARALGARDVALGLQILRGVREEQPVGHWITAGFVADAADVTAAVIAARHLTPARRVAMPVIAAAVGAAGVLSGKLNAT